MSEYRHHKYTWSMPFGNVHHEWTLIGPLGGLQFHVTILDPPPQFGGASAGLEIHHREPPEHMRGEAPSQLGCKLTGGWCWHEGTSLYAQDSLWPVVEGLLRAGNHEGIFRFLEAEATRRFEGEEADSE